MYIRISVLPLLLQEIGCVCDDPQRDCCVGHNQVHSAISHFPINLCWVFLFGPEGWSAS